MSRFREELGVIPGVAWVIAGLFFVFIEVMMWKMAFPSDPELRNGPFPVLVFLSILAAAVLPVYILLVGYVSGDAERRGMRRVLWTLVAIFVPNAIGIILYFFLREPILATCPRCATAVKPTFAYCYQCGTEIAQACSHCHRPVEPNWKACAYCGADLVARQSDGVAQVNPAPNPGPLA
jgi:hypothetical protein